MQSRGQRKRTGPLNHPRPVSFHFPPFSFMGCPQGLCPGAWAVGIYLYQMDSIWFWLWQDVFYKRTPFYLYAHTVNRRHSHQLSVKRHRQAARRRHSVFYFLPPFRLPFGFISAPRRSFCLVK